MPELPEVEVARRNLERWSAGRQVVRVRLEAPSSARSAASSRPATDGDPAADRVRALAGQRAGPIHRHGKRLGWCFERQGLLVHLGMTGRWSRRTDDEVPRWARLGLTLDDDATVWFIDPRRFGYVTPVARDALDDALRQGLGPDALDAPPSAATLAARLRTRKPVKVALMEQERIAGLGNIQAVEALWRARIPPGTPANRLDAEAWERLAAAIPAQLEEGIAVTEADEVAYLSDGAHVENPFHVYGREGAPCRACGAPIQRATLGGRSTFWCPSCQPVPSPA